MHWKYKLGTFVGGALMLLGLVMSEWAQRLNRSPSAPYSAYRLLAFAGAIYMYAKLAILCIAISYARQNRVFSHLRNIIRNWSPSMSGRIKCIITGVVFLFIAFAVQDKAMQAAANPSTMMGAYRFRFLADGIALCAGVLILRGAIPYALERFGLIVAPGVMLRREPPAEQEEPCASAE